MTTPGGQASTQRVDAHFSIGALRAPVREGEIIGGRYLVDRVLGYGGMGVVVAATHLGLEQKVAIKFVLPPGAKNEALRERFVREARAVAGLRSEHVTKVLDVGTLANGAPYMVMELLEGCDLAALLAQHGPLPVETAADYIAQACEAVAEAHSQGIIHRDIKPQNLFLTTHVGGASLVKVLDFGVSKRSIGGLENLTQSTALMGSPLYMSPEQMRSARDVDPRSDVWSLGVVLFELLTGRVPFDADSMPALCLKVVGDDAPRIERHRDDVPAELVAVVLRCLAKDPERRYRDAAELATALERFVTPASRIGVARTRACMAMSGTRSSHATHSSAPPTTLATMPPRASRGPLVAGIAAVAVILASLGGGAAVLHARAGATEARAIVASTVASALAALPDEAPAPEPVVAPPVASSPTTVDQPTTLPPKPLPQKPSAPRPPPKPITNDDDIPEYR
jgi:serine/threonine-protein kinase